MAEHERLDGPTLEGGAPGILGRDESVVAKARALDGLTLDERAEIEYRADGKRALRFVRVTSCEVEKDARRCLFALRENDSAASDAYYKVPDWSEGQEGERVSIRLSSDIEGIILYGVTWTCEPSVDWESAEWRNEFPSINGETLIQFSRMTYGGKSTANLDHALSAYLKANESRFRTPMDADVCALWFMRHLETSIQESVREAFTPPIRQLLNQAARAAEPMPTGIERLDGILHGGLIRGGVYSLAGDPSAGKTALAVQVAMFMAHQCDGNDVAVYLMLDQGGRSEIAKRACALSYALAQDADTHAPLDGCELSRVHEWADEEREEAISAYERITNDRLIMADVPNNSLDGIMGILDGIERNGGMCATFVAIDYFQLVAEGGTNVTTGSDAEFASWAMRTLREWANRHRTPVLLIGQFTKTAIEAHAKGAAPRMTDLLGSVDVPYQSEAVIMLTNPHDGSETVEICDAKHRHAGNDAQAERSTRLKLDGEHGLFTEV